MDDLVRRQDLFDALANSSDTWANDVQGIRAWWPHAVKIKDNILREIEKLEAVPVADKKKLTELLVESGRRVNAGSLAEYILNNCAVFATNHLPLEQKVRSECPSNDYCKGWNDAVKQMDASHMQAFPCRVGDKLWLNVGKSGPWELDVEEVRFRKDGCVISLERGAFVADITPEDIGKKAFFSEKEALAAFEESLKVVEDVLADAASKCEELNNMAQKEPPTKNPLWDSSKWGRLDMDGSYEDEYEFY